MQRQARGDWQRQEDKGTATCCLGVRRSIVRQWHGASGALFLLCHAGRRSVGTAAGSGGRKLWEQRSCTNPGHQASGLLASRLCRQLQGPATGKRRADQPPLRLPHHACIQDGLYDEIEPIPMPDAQCHKSALGMSTPCCVPLRAVPPAASSCDMATSLTVRGRSCSAVPASLCRSASRSAPRANCVIACCGWL